MRYINNSFEKSNGVVYTPQKMADYLASQILTISNIDFKNANSVRILDPAVGSGELLNSLISQLLKINEFISITAVAYETDAVVSRQTQLSLRKNFPQINIHIFNEDFLYAANTCTDKFDLIIANPPYIRTQILGTEKAQQIAQDLGLHGRIDLYYAFILYAKKFLSPNGIAGYITSNKFLTIKSGISVRNYMLKNYKIYSIVDFGDTKLFSASVLPCILIFGQGTTTEAKSVSFTTIYENKNPAEAIIQCHSIFDKIFDSCFCELPDGKVYEIQHGELQSTQENALWIITSPQKNIWMQTVKERIWKYVRDIGKIRVGIKTTADNVFIGNNWSGEKAQIELLRPLITHRDSGQIISRRNAGWKVLYTHTIKNGKKAVVDIDDFPISKKYLETYYRQLSERKYIQAAHRKWYEIWVPQNPAAWSKRKIIFRDISERPEFWLDESGAIVNGDCYWIEIDDSVTEDVLYLVLAVMNSNFIEKYYDYKFNTKLYSGKRRYMSQYVELFPIPNPNSPLAQSTIAIVKQIIHMTGNEDIKNLMLRLNAYINAMFGV